MEILFCGTGAAEGWPALFCTCTPCQTARERGGKEIRSRAAYMLDDRIRIDFGPDSNLHQQKYGLAYERLKHLIITHSHDDHLFPTDIGYRRRGFSAIGPDPLHVWGNDRVEARITSVLGEDWEKYNVVYHRVAPWEPMDLGAGLTACPVVAAHDPAETCLNYRIEIGGKAALFGHDTGWYNEPTWEFLSDRPLDLVIFDCTYCLKDHDRGHMGGMALIRARDELAKRGALTSNARCVATHFSHNGGSLHDEMEAFFTPQGFTVAYDGMRLTL